MHKFLNVKNMQWIQFIAVQKFYHEKDSMMFESNQVLFLRKTSINILSMYLKLIKSVHKLPYFWVTRSHSLLFDRAFWLQKHENLTTTNALSYIIWIDSNYPNLRSILPKCYRIEIKGWSHKIVHWFWCGEWCDNLYISSW